MSKDAADGSAMRPKQGPRKMHERLPSCSAERLRGMLKAIRSETGQFKKFSLKILAVIGLLCRVIR